MKTIKNLCDVPWNLTDCLAVGSETVPGDELHVWIPLEPVQDGPGLSREKQVDRAVCEQIADDGPIRMSFFERKVIDSNKRGRSSFPPLYDKQGGVPCHGWSGHRSLNRTSLSRTRSMKRREIVSERPNGHFVFDRRGAIPVALRKPFDRRCRCHKTI